MSALVKPNFDAFRENITEGTPSREAVVKWADKLEALVDDLIEQVQALEAQASRVDALEKELAEAADAREALEALQDRILDMERGVVDPHELVADVR